MVWFTFTFLLGIPDENEEKLEETSAKDAKKLNSDQEHLEIEVSKPNFMCHIEYILLPQEAPKFIDVACWDGAAKIYFENSTAAIIPLNVVKLRWIHFRVNHKINLKLEDIPLFHSHNVKFSVSLGNKKFREAAKSDKPKKFFAPNFSNPQIFDSVRKQIFQPLSETLENLPEVSYFKEHLTSLQNLYISLDTTIETSKNYGKLFKTLVELSKEYHDENFERVPTPPCEESPPVINILQQKADEASESKKGKDKKQDKKLDKKTAEVNKEPEKMEFLLTGEQFLSGKKTFESRLKYNSEELPYVICLAATKNVLSKNQASFYQPLSIEILSLDNLPVDLLKKDGVTKIKFRFLICNHLLAESNLIPIDKRMKINHTRTIFTYTIDKKELIYFIQTGGLYIEILGSLTKSKPIVENVKRGAKLMKNDENDSEDLGSETFVTLGSVFTDISSILLQPHRMTLKSYVQMTNKSGFSRKNITQKFTSINEFNSCQKRQKTEDFYLARYSKILNPVLTIAASLGHPLYDVWDTVLRNPNLFNRLIAVFYNVELAVPLIQMIQVEVDGILGLNDFTKNGKNLKRPLTKYYKGDVENIDCLRKTQMTGFLVDCVDKILIYAESPVFGKIQKVWAFTSCLSPLQGHVLYDSSLIFLDRLYENLFEFGGFIGISLNEPLQMILSKPQSYSKQSIPQPAWEAMRCIGLLANCKSIKTATQNNLLPDFNSLVSLAIEFGTPIRISDKR